MNLVETIKNIQRAVGAEPDGVFGPRTAGAVLREIVRRDGIDTRNGNDATTGGPTVTRLVNGDDAHDIDERSMAAIKTLDAKAQPLFLDFLRKAKATAATLGCNYIAICGTRTWDEQDELYEQGRGKPGKVVTRARGGYSWHNFGVAIDCGVFRGKVYLDDADPRLAERVHAACAAHAEACGLEAGYHWIGRACDPVHYQVKKGVSTPTNEHRRIFKEKGSVL